MSEESLNTATRLSEAPSFDAYLARLGLAPTTRRTYARSADLFTAWMEGERLALGDLTYRDLLAWVRSLGGAAKTRSLHLSAVRHLLAWHEERGLITHNPAASVHVRGVKRPLPSGLLTEAQLSKLVREYVLVRGYEAGTTAEGVNLSRQRNKAILGVLAYQGLGAGELARLDLADLDLEGGTLAVPGSRTRSARILTLRGEQVLALHRYLLEGRPSLLAETGKMTDRLFVSAGSGAKLNNALSVLMRCLRARYPWFENARQLRASRITLWLRAFGLRETQYLAGHRYVSSTERYRATDLDALHAALERHHPQG